MHLVSGNGCWNWKWLGKTVETCKVCMNSKFCPIGYQAKIFFRKNLVSFALPCLPLIDLPSLFVGKRSEPHWGVGEKTLCCCAWPYIYIMCKYIIVICSHTGDYTDHLMDSSGRFGDFMETHMHQRNETVDMPDFVVMKNEMATDSKTEER